MRPQSQHEATMAYTQTGFGNVDMVLLAVRREFDEMPGLALTADQARRLWALEPRMCAVALSQLVESGYLRQTGTGQYVKPSAA
jgi:hypothetical protein